MDADGLIYLGGTMKTCKNKNCEKLGILLPESEFYKHVDSPDGLDIWCKKCRYEDTRMRLKSGTRQLPWSTDKVLQLLSQNGIPATIGRIVGKPRQDIVAYGYLTVEAKSALPKRTKDQYAFNLTKTQRTERCDYYVLVCRDTERAFVIPGDSELITLNFTKIFLDMGDPRLEQYENGYDQIKQRLIKEVLKSAPIMAVRVLSGEKYYQVSCSR
jgi:hypothetical protein